MPRRTADQNTWSLPCCWLQKPVPVFTALLYSCRTGVCAFPQVRKRLQMSGAISGLQSSHRGEWFSGFINHFCMKNRRKRQWCLIYEAVGSAVCWNGFHFVSAAQLEIIRRMILTVLFLCILMYVWDSLLSAGYHPKQRKKHILPGLQMYTANWCTCVLVWALQRVQKANENLMQGNLEGIFFFFLVAFLSLILSLVRKKLPFDGKCTCDMK